MDMARECVLECTSTVLVYRIVNHCDERLVLAEQQGFRESPEIVDVRIDRHCHVAGARCG